MVVRKCLILIEAKNKANTVDNLKANSPTLVSRKTKQNRNWVVQLCLCKFEVEENHECSFKLVRFSSESQHPVPVGSGKRTAGIFVGGFVLGGIIVGALGCVYAPQISKALAVAGADRKDLMRKLPKFIYDEEKALEKTRKILAEKIAQLNSAIDDVSAQLHADDDAPNGAAVSSDEVEASI